MSQDTRKDPRAKIVSLNVRYKSATVDEFIDNHASDVSKGGIFIKTSTPFPQGTLLKFEIRLAGDQSVIAGVGRVVWKRDPAAASGTQNPAGMGVKFIKLDDSSRAVIDKLVASREDAGSSFTSQLEGDTTQVDNKSPTAGAGALKSTQQGIGPSVKATIAGMGAAVKPGTTGASGSTAPRPNAGNVKSTIVGMPSPVQPDAPATGGAKPAAGSGFFPGSAESAAADMPPPGERTVMKQAAELLEEALKEAGGSMEEVGTNPLFEKSKPPPAVEKLPEPTAADIAEEKAEAKAAERAETRPVEVPAVGATSASDRPKAAPAETVALPKATPKSEPPKSERPKVAAKAVSAKSFVEEPEKKSSLAPFIAITLLILGGGALLIGYKNGAFGGAAPVDTTPPVTTPSTTASAPPIDSAIAVVDASATAIPEQTDAAAMMAMAKDAGLAKPIASAAPKPPPTTRPRPPKPPPTSTATAPTSTDTAPASTDTTAPTSTAPTPTPTTTATSTSTAAPTSTSTAGSGSHSSGDDNPY